MKREIDLEKGIQKCNKCNEWKPLDDFTNHKRMKYGKDTTCLSCSLEKSKKYKNPEKKSKYDKLYYEENKKEKIKYAEEYRKKNRGKINEWQNHYSKTPVRKQKKAIYNSKRRAIIMSQETYTDITTEYLLELKKETIFCEECGCLLNDIAIHPQQYNLDHIIPLSKGGTHTKNNVRYICRICNIKKGNKIT